MYSTSWCPATLFSNYSNNSLFASITPDSNTRGSVHVCHERNNFGKFQVNTSTSYGDILVKELLKSFISYLTHLGLKFKNAEIRICLFLLRNIFKPNFVFSSITNFTIPRLPPEHSILKKWTPVQISLSFFNSFGLALKVNQRFYICN